MVSSQDISRLIDTIHQVSKYNFLDYSEKSFQRRVEKILLDNRMNITALVEKVKNNKDFLEKVVKDITVNTTELFRDPEVWITLRHRILPRYKNNKSIFIWHASPALLREIMYTNKLFVCIQIKIY